MKNLLSKVSCFLVCGYLLAWVVDFLCSKAASESNYGQVECWTNLMKGRIDSDCVILGSSRAIEHIAPTVLDSVLGTNSYNLGAPGHHMDIIEIKYRLFSDRNNRPELVLINVDNTSLLISLMINKYQYYPWFHDKDFREVMFSTFDFTFGELFLPMYRYSGYSGMFSPEKESLIKGWRGRDEVFDSTLVDEKSLVFKIDRDVEKKFLSLLDTIIDDGIKVVLFFSPVYVDTYREMPNQEEFKAYYDSVSRAKDIPLLDYTQMSICKDTSYFRNGLHLNRRGAIAFSDSLANDIKRLGLVE